ncbi:MAG: MBL fold metallo-hydrolase [Treponema sp.]|nr:MBL fold metallo-hydrolase [Treponema sp.]
MLTKSFGSKIELTNSGELSLFFVGTGSAFTKRNFQTNLFIIKGQDHILVDCGTLCPYALETAYNTPVKEVSNLFVTHPHADHIGGVEELALIGCYVKKQKLNFIITDKLKKKLWNESLRGGCQFSEDGKMNFDDYFNQLKPALIQKKPYEIYEINVGSINLKIIRTRHITTRADSLKNSQLSYGIIIDNKIFFTGDTQFNKHQLEWVTTAYPIETIFADCDVGGYAEAVHESYNQLKTLDVEMRQKMYLCHYNKQAESVNPEADGFAGFAQAGIYYIY